MKIYNNKEEMRGRKHYNDVDGFVVVIVIVIVVAVVVVAGIYPLLLLLHSCPN